MHEYSITCSIIEILKKVAKEKNIKKIKRISFEISPITHIEPGSIEFYYNFLTKEDNILKNAKLIFKKEKFEILCQDCKKKYKIDKFLARCPDCSGENVRLLERDDIRIISVEV